MTALIRAVLSVVLFAMLTVTMPPSGLAQTEDAPKIDRSKLLVQPRGEKDQVTASPWREPFLWVQQQQRAFYGSMSQSMRRMKSDAPFAAAMTLMLLSFGYGIFHAAGPGHGKAVISAWLIATENELRRGILVAFMSALVQALTAITIVSALLLLVTAVGSAARDVAGFLESASYLLIALMGAYLIWTAFRPAHAVAAAHDHGQAHSSHDHRHDHGDDCGCGHAHAPAAAQVKGEWSLAKASSLAFAVGIRPCSGAILALIFANAIGLYWAGVASTVVMALGTAITVSVIAACAVYAKQMAIHIARGESNWLAFAATATRLCAGVVIVGLGGILFWGSLGTVNAMM